MRMWARVHAVGRRAGSRRSSQQRNEVKPRSSDGSERRERSGSRAVLSDSFCVRVVTWLTNT
eukprot:1504680-Prymnesium_polylepis.1